MKKSYSIAVLQRKRSNRLLVAVLTALCAVSASALFAQDAQRLGERSIMGTARYVGMSGAMTAVGGDPSAALDNPAGLGLYRHHEVMLTLDDAIDYTFQRGTSLRGKTNLFMAPQASIVIHIPTNAVDGVGVQANNFLFSYHRVQSYNRLYDVQGLEGIPSLGELFASTGVEINIPYCQERVNVSNGLKLREWGYVNNYTFDWAMNIAHKWYVGLGLRIHSFSFNAEAEYDETFDRYNAQEQVWYNNNWTSLLFNGAGVSMAAGLICRPLSWMRLGFGLETPSVGKIRRSTNGDLQARMDSVRNNTWITDKELDFHQPLHLSASVAFQVNYYAMIALQYDYRHQSDALDNHGFRMGLEVIPVPGLYINAGYAFESAFSRSNNVVHVDPTQHRLDAYFQRLRWSQYVSGGLGYRGKYFVVQAAYQYRWQRVHLYAHENAVDNPYDLNTAAHRIVFTFGWRR